MVPNYLTAGAGGVTSSSPDGTTWTAGSVGSSDDVRALWFAHGNVYAGLDSTGGSNVRMSTDGSSWTSLRADGQRVNCGMTANGLMVAGKTAAGGHPSNVMTSRDGVTWTEQGAVIGGTNGAATGACFALGKYFVCGAVTGSVAAVASSPDGTAWTSALADGSSWNGIAGRDFDVVIVNGTEIRRSTDGTTWTSVQSGNFNAVAQAYAGGAFTGQGYVAVGAAGLLMHSFDGVTWTTPSNPLGSGVTMEAVYCVVLDVTGGGNWLFVATASSGAIITSNDGITWTTQTSGTASALYAASSVPFSLYTRRAVYAFPLDLTSSQFRKNLMLALMLRAQAILAESTGVTNHAGRLQFANGILANPGAVADRMTWALLGDPAVAANGNAIWDQDLSDAIDAVFGMYTPVL